VRFYAMWGSEGVRNPLILLDGALSCASVRTKNSDYESTALTAELRARVRGNLIITHQLPGIRFNQPGPGNLNHDCRKQGQQKAGHLRMGGPHNLPEAERPGTQPNCRSNPGSDQRDFQGFHCLSVILRYDQHSSFVPPEFCLVPVRDSTTHSLLCRHPGR